ncbi:hypothetical protein BV22DRAFT_1131101 [Leucogyrophana mollusca]|uniref:Uncharacterized protein n=1 Tax=Leucogyrophana mollusca TaxID=85980 RepID=A0ACB8BDE8_9AGAM|nr:hypothetical protein BV22DRAFT_1131101 [Leucogyrophana mollusca]
MTADSIVQLNNCRSIAMNFQVDAHLIFADLQSTGQLSSLTWRMSPSGPPHDPRWTSTCVISGVVYGVGTGTNKSNAKKAAATIALRALGQG